MLLSTELDLRETGGILWGSLSARETKNQAWAFLDGPVGIPSGFRPLVRPLPMDPIFETARLRFLLMSPDHEADLERLDGDPRVREFFPGGVNARPTTRDRIANNRASFATLGYCDFTVVDRVTGTFLGRAGFHRLDNGEVEVGYLFRPQFWGRGHATEALRGLLSWVRSIPTTETIPKRRIIAFTHSHHLASLRVMQKAGMSLLETAPWDEEGYVFYQAPL